MKKDSSTARTIIIMVALLLPAMAAAGGTALAEEAAYKTIPAGEKAPLFKSSTIDGKPFDLEELLARKGVALFFWSLFCSPCREEMPGIQKIHAEFKDQVEIIGMNLDEPPLHNAVRSFLKTSGYNFPVVVNKSATADSQCDKLYLITGTPVLYIIRQDGSIAFSHVGRLEEEQLKKLIVDNLVTPRS